MNLVLDRPFVAVAAGHFLMGAGELVIRLGVVIEAPQVPAIGIVALLAMRPQRAFMDIIRLVATIACQCGPFVGRVKMAFFARGGRMQADEWKTGQAMIEDHLFSPTPLIMATRAFFTFLAVMYIIRLVAGKTVAR